DNRQYFLFDPEAVDGSPAKAEKKVSLELPGYEYMKIFEIRRKQPQHRVFAAETAYHLYVWYRDNRFCGRCGSPTVADSRERMLRCPHCGNMIFPKIVPAVIVGVTRGDEILLTTYANREYKRYALIAGFTEIGETAEETVAREVMEEVGLPVKNIRYYKSQPWGFECDLLLGFYCEVDEGRADGDLICMDEQELASAQWVKREDMPEYPEEISLTHEMMMRFKYGNI
ncbi:MAG: NAD(+) diphosphatase, partial [Lachnospiraceae bacterium]|nr:NAD(+) diphosphatase [Lachnospiraceae bacterium]